MAKIEPEEYDKEPVLHCQECISLRIRSVQDQDYCDSCGSTSIVEASVDEWVEKYSAMWGKDKILKHKSIFKSE